MSRIFTLLLGAAVVCLSWPLPVQAACTSSTFTTATIDGSFDGAESVHAVDMDGDSDIDIVAAALSANDVVWYESDGSESFTKNTIDANLGFASYVAAVDLDGDGDMDVLASSLAGDDVVWYENDGSESFTQNVIDGSLDGASSITAVDLDEDGDIDVVVSQHSSADAGDGDVVWYENDGSESFTKNTVDTSLWGSHESTVIDLDEDNDLDIVAVSANLDDLVWYENDGSESFTKATIDSNLSSARTVKVADIDGDSDYDVVAGAPGSDDLVWYENDGSESFTKTTIDSDVDAESVDLADIDQDGSIDIVTADFANGDIEWYANDGSGSFTNTTIETALTRPTFVHIFDIDSDSDLDIVAADANADDVVWFKHACEGSEPEVSQQSATDANGGTAPSSYILEDSTVRITAQQSSDGTQEIYFLPQEEQRISVLVPHQGELLEVYIRTVGQIYPLRLNGHGSYEVQLNLPVGTHPYALTADWGGATRTTYGTITVAHEDVVPLTDINKLFRFVFDRTPTVAEWRYWVGRLADKPRRPDFIGALQWQLVHGGLDNY